MPQITINGCSQFATIVVKCLAGFEREEKRALKTKSRKRRKQSQFQLSFLLPRKKIMRNENKWGNNWGLERGSLKRRQAERQFTLWATLVERRQCWLCEEAKQLESSSWAVFKDFVSTLLVLLFLCTFGELCNHLWYLNQCDCDDYRQSSSAYLVNDCIDNFLDLSSGWGNDSTWFSYFL